MKVNVERNNIYIETFKNIESNKKCLIVKKQ